MHRDIKPKNILVESRVPFRLKLADFGFATDTSSMMTFCGTDIYMPPAIGLVREPYGRDVDLWSLGIVVIEYAYGLPRRQLFLENGKLRYEDWKVTLEEVIEWEEANEDEMARFLGGTMCSDSSKKRVSAEHCRKMVLTPGARSTFLARGDPSGATKTASPAPADSGPPPLTSNVASSAGTGRTLRDSRQGEMAPNTIHRPGNATHRPGASNTRVPALDAGRKRHKDDSSASGVGAKRPWPAK